MKLEVRLYKKKKRLDSIEYNYLYLEQAKKHAQALMERFGADSYRIFKDGMRVG